MEMDINSHHPDPLPNPHHRRIELQSPLDLTYLQHNLAVSAEQKLALHFPPSTFRKLAQPATCISLDGPQQDASTDSSKPQQPPTRQQQIDDDPLLARVQSLVSSFLNRTWAGAAQNISINGLDASSLPNASFPPISQPLAQERTAERDGIDFTYAAYDSRLQQQVASLYGELESLTAQVSKLRREAPSSGAEKYTGALREQIAREEEDHEREIRTLRAQQQSLQSKDREHAPDVLKLETPRPGYYEDMQATYSHGVEELALLAVVSGRDGDTGAAGEQGGGSLTETVGKVQRARTVAMEFE